MKYLSHFGLCAAILVLCSSEPSRLRAQQRIFRSGVDLVQLSVVVLDRERRPVTGLTAADFTILVDGVPRDVAGFAAITLSTPEISGATLARDLQRDVVTNESRDDGRLVVVMMDHSIPAGGMAIAARKIARSVIDAMGPNDLAAVVRSSPFAGEGVSQNFTADRRLLISAVESPFMGLTKAPPTGPSGGIDRVPGLGDSIACPCGICQWHAITRVADAMTHSPSGRHKTLLFIGRDIVVQASGIEDDCSLRVRYARDNALRALDRANVTVHSIDPSGLETLQASASGTARLPPQQNLTRQGNLRVLPDYTGGRTVLNTNAPESLVPELFAESQSWYLLAFDRTPGERSDERREIDVRVNRPGVTVRSRRGYYAATDEGRASDASDALGATITPLLPVSDIPLRLAATPLFQADGSTAVGLALGFGGGADDTTREPRAFDLIVGVFDQQANPITAARQHVTIPGDASPTYEWHSFFPIEPGRYDVRVGVMEGEGDARRRGSVYASVEVTDPGGSDLALSGLRLRSRLKTGTDAEAEPVLLRRVFDGAADDVVAELQVRAQSDSGDVEVSAEVTDVSGQVVHRVAGNGPRFNEAGVATIGIPVPVGSLGSGTYVLIVRVATAGRVDSRQTSFAVQP